MLRLPAFALVFACASFAAADSDFQQTGAGRKSGYSSSDFQQSGSAAAANANAWQGMNDANASAPNGSGENEKGENRSGPNASGPNGRGPNANSQNKNGQNKNGQNENGPHENNQGEGGSEDDPENAPDDAPSAAMSLSDARVNFEAVVEAYVAKKSVDGYWSYREKSGGKARKLKFVSFDSGSVQNAGDNVYTGVAALREASGRRSSLEFKVDFSGSDWRVVSVKPRPAKGKGR